MESFIALFWSYKINLNLNLTPKNKLIFKFRNFEKFKIS